MNEPQLNQKIEQEVFRVKKDMNNLKEDGINKASHIGEDVKQSTEDMSSRVNGGVAQLSSDFEKVKDDTAKTVANATSSVKKNVGDGLVQYNAKAAEVAEKFPGGVGAMVGKYPWVAMSFALLAGIFLRGIFMPSRHHR